MPNGALWPYLETEGLKVKIIEDNVTMKISHNFPEYVPSGPNAAQDIHTLSKKVQEIYEECGYINTPRHSTNPFTNDGTTIILNFSRAHNGAKSIADSLSTNYSTATLRSELKLARR